MNTSVVSDIARPVVATGKRTWLGSRARHLAGKRSLTAFDLATFALLWYIFGANAVVEMAPLPWGDYPWLAEREEP